MLLPAGRVILVSGANRGIGRAIAEHLYAQGYSLSLGARDPAKLKPIVDGWDGARVHTARYDAANRATHGAWVAAAHARFQRIDGLVNNAGISRSITIRDDDEEGLDEVWTTNVKAPLNMIRLALPHLEASGSGRIVNVASLSGKRVKNDNIAYAMSKFAVVALSHGVRRLGWSSGVRATAVCPSFVATDMTVGPPYAAKIDRADMTDPRDLAVLVATLIALPNTASIAELLVNCRLEDTL